MKKTILVLMMTLFVLFLITGCNSTIGPGLPGEESHAGILSGWLFEVETDTGVQKFLATGNEGNEVMNELEILEWTRYDSWQEPSLVWTLEEWSADCERQRSGTKDCSEEMWESENQEKIENCVEEPEQVMPPQEPQENGDVSVPPTIQPTVTCPPKIKDYEDWLADCESYNEMLQECSYLPFEDFEEIMNNYLIENSIDGTIADKYVAQFPIFGTGNPIE